MEREVAMKRRGWMLPAWVSLFLLTANPARTAELKLEFRAPTVENPNFLISTTLEVKGKLFHFLDVDFPKGSPSKDAAVLRNGRPVDTSKNLEPGLYSIVIRFAWRSGTSYSAFLHVIEDEREGPKTIEMRGTAPVSGGVPGPVEEGFFMPYLVEEDAGIDRRGEIIYSTLTAPKIEMEGSLFAVYDGGRRLLHQLIETKESVPPESQAKTHPVTETKNLAVAVDVAAGEKKLLLVFKEKSAPPSSDAFTLSGTGLGKTVKGSKYALELSPQSGQILTIEDFTAGIKLFNKAGVIHWNPDVFTPGIAWDHSFDWNPPHEFAERNGPLVYLNSRRGSMPRIKDVFLEVKYSLEKDAPFFLTETRMRVDKDLGVVALRNDEMVLFKELFDAIVYKDKTGALVQKPLRALPDRPFGLAHIAAPDLDWVGLLNTKAGYGFFSLRLESSVSNLDPGGNLLLRPGTYFYAPSDGDYVYWVRPWNYTWGEFATSNRLTALPAGSVIYEKNAYLVARWNADTPAALDTLHRRLKNPLRVF